MEKPLTAVILAAGEGKRMHSSLPKVLHRICGRSLVEWALHALDGLLQEPPVVVVGHGAEQVQEHLGQRARYALQQQQRGTGHALQCAQEYFSGRQGKLLVIAGDMPLMEKETLEQLAGLECAAALLTAKLPDPAGYGRVVRDAAGKVRAIVEHRDATEEERAVNEVNLSAYCFDISALCDCLARLTCDNDQGEYYLTDCVGLLYQNGLTVQTICVPAYEGMGVNDRTQLADCTRILRRRINAAHMQNGVTMIDPEQTYLDATVKLGQDCILYPGVVLEGNTLVEEGTILYPGCRLVDTHIGKRCALKAVNAQDAVVGDGVTIGPFVNLRPGAKLADGCKVGDFVEVKNSTVGKGSKLPHLSYIGDADVGSHVNLGCGTVFVNYDGYRKHRTTVGDNVFIGCNTSLVAPVTVGDGAYTAAGSVITEDVPEECLAIARARQVNKLGYVARIQARQRREENKKGD